MIIYKFIKIENGIKRFAYLRFLFPPILKQSLRMILRDHTVCNTRPAAKLFQFLRRDYKILITLTARRINPSFASSATQIFGFCIPRSLDYSTLSIFTYNLQDSAGLSRILHAQILNAYKFSKSLVDDIRSRIILMKHVCTQKKLHSYIVNI